jgi:DNA (cytosine-5)-methyltransferase 1
MNLQDFLTTYAAPKPPRIQARPQPAPTRTLADFLRAHAVPAQRQTPRAFQPGTFTNLLRGIDLFAGAGGFTIGSVDAGLPITLAAEFDAAAVQTSRRAGHAAEVMDVGDVGDTDQATLYGVDVIIGGPPCQPFSSMGARAGKYDPRDGFPLVLKAIEHIEPKRVVFENVKGFLSPANKAYRDRVMDDLAKHFRHVGIWQLNAKDFGVPQDRERVFIWGAEIFLDPPVPTHGPRAGQPYRSVAQALPQLGAPAVHVRATTARSRSTAEPSPTVTTKGTMYTALREGLVYGRDPAKGRRLTVPELGALQGFPGAFEFTGRMGDRYKQVGNAVPPALGEAVVRSVLAGMRAERMKPSRVLDLLKEEHPEALLLEPRADARDEHGKRVRGFDHALIGVTNTSKGCPGKLVAVYDRDLVIDIAMDQDFAYGYHDPEDEDDREEAWEGAHAWLDSVESGMGFGEPDPVIQRRDPDQMDLDEEALYQQGSENRRKRRRPVRRIGWLSA